MFSLALSIPFNRKLQTFDVSQVDDGTTVRDKILNCEVYLAPGWWQPQSWNGQTWCRGAPMVRWHGLMFLKGVLQGLQHGLMFRTGAVIKYWSAGLSTQNTEPCRKWRRCSETLKMIWCFSMFIASRVEDDAQTAKIPGTFLTKLQILRYGEITLSCFPWYSSLATVLIFLRTSGVNPWSGSVSRLVWATSTGAAERRAAAAPGTIKFYLSVTLTTNSLSNQAGGSGSGSAPGPRSGLMFLLFLIKAWLSKKTACHHLQFKASRQEMTQNKRHRPTSVTSNKRHVWKGSWDSVTDSSTNQPEHIFIVLL